MVHTAILGRRLDRPVINLGFSGNGKMEPELAELLAELDPAVYVLDCLPNMTAEEVDARVEPFVRALRKAHPETPIVLAEDRTYANARRVTWRIGTMVDRLVAALILGTVLIPDSGLVSWAGDEGKPAEHPDGRLVGSDARSAREGLDEIEALDRCRASGLAFGEEIIDQEQGVDDPRVARFLRGGFRSGSTEGSGTLLIGLAQQRDEVISQVGEGDVGDALAAVRPLGHVGVHKAREPVGLPVQRRARRDPVVTKVRGQVGHLVADLGEQQLRRRC